MKTFAVSSVLVIGAGILFVVGMFSGNGGLMMAIFCSWTPLVAFWGFSFGRMRLQISVNNHTVIDTQPNARQRGDKPQNIDLLPRESRLRKKT